MNFDDAVKSGLIETMGDETDRKFMANVTAMINDRETVAKVADTFKLVYTPFHGCGYKLVPEALRRAGHQAPDSRAGADGHRRQFPHGGLSQPGKPGGLLSGRRSGQKE